MKYIVAVSGGVDSVVLLDILVRSGRRDLVVAHFDHGIRSDSAADARFVKRLAAHYGLPFAMQREELGANASEDLARSRRYAFLESVAAKHDGYAIATAHHGDDIVETIAINLVRGTGWRGLAVFGRAERIRPLLKFRKEQLYDYALRHKLEWVEDSTNEQGNYLRNRVRRQIAVSLSDDGRQQVLDLWEQQRVLQDQIEHELEEYVTPDGCYQRHMFIQIDSATAVEILRAVVVAQTQLSPMRPQLERAVLAIKTARDGTIFELGAGVRLEFSRRTFNVQAP